MKKTINVVSRDSELALWQTRYAIDVLRPYFPESEFRIISTKTKGDKILDASLSKIGDKGLFTNELEAMMRDGTADMAVHSLKDMPTTLGPGLELSCFLKRYDPRDAFLSKHPGGIQDLPHGAIVGTSSLRRRSQLLAMRPDLEVRDLRGNVNTRLRKFHEGPFDACVLAVAGLERLGKGEEISLKLDEEEFIPAVGQGVLVIETQSGRRDLHEVLDQVTDRNTLYAVLAERAFMRDLEGGCQVPIGANASVADGLITMHGFVGSLDGRKLLRRKVVGPVNDAEKLGTILADSLRDLGAQSILDEIRKAER